MMRDVIPFVDLDAAEVNRQARGACILMDVHGMWWSVPVELTILMVHQQMIAWLDACDLRPIEPMKPHQRTMGVRPC